MTELLKSFNPASGELIGQVPVSSTSDVEAAVNRARVAAVDWRKLSLEERGQMLARAGEALCAEAEKLGSLLSQEMGKPLKRGISEVNFCGRGIRSKVDEITAALQPTIQKDAGVTSTIYYEPMGVCAAISPWNYPMSMPQSLVLPALMAGNTVVLKPSEETPLIAQAYVDVLNRYLPEHVLQIVHGADEQGKALVNANIDLIAFTGSRNAGKQILGSAAKGLKRVVLELGGKDPLIVLPDADIEKAVQCAVDNGYENAGQMCVSTERIYVDATIVNEFEKTLAEKVSQIEFGPWDKDGVQMGPMINERQRQLVIDQIDAAVSQGAKLVAGGADHPPRYVRPTVLSQCTSDMSIMRDETFGPVVCIQTVETADEAIKLSNDNPYGLGGAIFGNSQQAKDIARRLDIGMIGINKSCFGASGTPWVGAKQSGYGYHGSAAGHRQFTQVKVVSEES